MDNPDFREFTQKIIDNIKKHGFPEKKVAFPLEQLYEAAYNKGINFNKVLETLDEIQIAHEKTPEKIIFFPKDRGEEDKVERAGPAKSPMDMFAHMAPDLMENMDMSSMKDMNMSDMMKAASQMLQKMDPEKLNTLKDTFGNMSEEERAELLENAKKMGLF